jgi:hypothetical protein
MLATLALSALLAATADPEPVAHWPLLVDGRSAVAGLPHAQPQGVTVVPGQGATFDGRGSHLVVPPFDALLPHKGDFTLSLRVHTEPSLDDDPGDLLSLYDPARRAGFNLSIRTNSGVTSNQANLRQLQFGIDAGSEPSWRDEGRPGTAVLGFAMAVHDGSLYVGTSGNAEGELGRVYRYESPGRWTDLGAPDLCNAVSAMAVHEGALHVGTARYRFAGSSMTESPNTALGGGIYRLMPDGSWREVGRLPGVEAVGGLVVFQGKLLAASLYKPAGLFRLETDGTWTSLPTPVDRRVEPLAVHDGALFAGSYDGGHVDRFDGERWQSLGPIGENTQTYSFADYRGRLSVGTWPSGRVYALNKNRTWDDLGRLGEELEVMGMLVHNGKLYGGTLPAADVYRLDDPLGWTRVGSIDPTPDVKYRRAWTMATHRGRLFASAMPSGHVWSLSAGPCATLDRPFPGGDHHIAAVKHGGLLRLFLDGQEVATSDPFDPETLDLDPASPLLIGAGAGGTFHGRITDLRIYHRALSSAEILTIARP